MDETQHWVALVVRRKVRLYVCIYWRERYIWNTALEYQHENIFVHRVTIHLWGKVPHRRIGVTSGTKVYVAAQVTSAVETCGAFLKAITCIQSFNVSSPFAS